MINGSTSKAEPPPMAEAEIKKQLQSSIQVLEDRSVNFKIKLEHLNKLADLKKHIPPTTDLSNYVSITQFIKSVRIFLATPPKTMRTSALRVLKFYTCDSKFIKELINLNVHYFITRSMERDKHSEAERIQALKLIRTIMELDCSLMPHSIVKALVAISENQEDTFCRVCLETLCEISIRNPQVSSHCGGIRTLFDSVLDPFYQGIQESLIISILYILNEEKYRIYVRPKHDLEIILSPLTNSFTYNLKPKSSSSKDKEKEKEREDELNMKKWQGSIKAVITLLKSWVGIISLSSDEQGLKSIVDGLRMPQLDLQDKVLDALFEIFRIAQPKALTNTTTNVNGANIDPFRTQKVVGGSVNYGADTLSDLPSRTRNLRHNLLNNYIAALLIAFIDCGLIDGLIYLGNFIAREGSDSEKEHFKNISLKSTVLLGELLHLSNTLLPPSQCAKLQTLPSLVNSAISFRMDPRVRSKSSTMVTNLHSFSHSKATYSLLDNSLAIGLTGANKWRRVKGQDRRLDKIDDVKMKMDWHMDDAQFQQKVKDTQVLVTKDITKWNWELIFEMLEGPLNNPTHLSNALKTKFIKRMLSFLRPNNKLFSTMAWTTENLKYVRVACVTLEVLISHEIGFDYLKDNKTIVQIAEMLKAEVDHSHANSQKTSSSFKDRLLNPERVLKTMSREYFTMLGTLSSNLLGLEILARNNIFDYIKPLSELPGRDDLSHLIMTSLDYNVNGASRTILQKILTSSSRVVRYLATKYMRFLLRSGVQDFSGWGVDLLVQQLNDSDAKVTALALSVLDEACDEVECLEQLIQLKETKLKDMHGKNGKNLTLRFLSRPSGLKYLLESNFVQEEESLWMRSENANYVITVENSISEALTPSAWRQKESTDQGNNGVYLPPHFFGELAKTEEGCQLIKKSNNFQKFLTVTKDNSANPLERRASIFAIGQIGSSLPGYQFIEENDVIPIIIELAEKSPCLSLRGTCFYALGMISCIEKARDVFFKYGWESPMDCTSRILVPKDTKTSTFLKINPYEYKGSWAEHSQETFNKNLFTDQIKNDIISYISNLSSHITAENASKNLKNLKVKSPEYFASGELLSVVITLLNTYKYRLGARRFIYDCFDTAIFSDDPFPYLENCNFKLNGQTKH
ncbi:cytosolic regulator of adenylyl cyclase [Tieghemostelium lacteum]|uniref:Cytosolic regulator of adenylyl cyclase n=1 Tax=Tieghemostelium lacteum TaxID=361077 RepID=A0A152A954_TIELA|nr:cytosolic regulator of adenylyl cyclase [Tieghemostelium lacteum]|eukprot:KYR02655.1 cytosolic regulator of adenylyl cyclase [Tieghemostelium lacteum]